MVNRKSIANSTTAGLAAVTILAAAFLIGGTMDYSDAIDQQKYYCDRVAAGDWPDYRQTFYQSCPDHELNIRIRVPGETAWDQ